VDLINQGNLADVGYPIPVYSINTDGYGFYPLYGVIAGVVAVPSYFHIIRRYKVPRITKEGKLSGSTFVHWDDLTKPRTGWEIATHVFTLAISYMILLCLTKSTLVIENLFAAQAVSGANQYDMTFYDTAVILGFGIGDIASIVQTCFFDKYTIYVAKHHLDQAAKTI